VDEIGLPCVIVNPPNPVSFNAVLPDDVTVANQVTAHLIENGHKKIGYVPRLASCTHGSQFDRMKGFSQAVNQNSLELIPGWDIPLGRGEGEVGIEDEHYLPDIKARLEFYLEKNNCTAVVAYDARIAARILVAAYEMGLKVPNDFSIIACDYESSLKRHICKVTAFKIDRSEIARCAVEMMMQMVEKGVDRINSIYVKGKFVQGDSVVAL
jgi:LacI family transcriptional regulator